MYKEKLLSNSRFVGFDILKFVCAFLIVCIHVPFPAIIGEYFTALTRIAVPIFFMITGFYYSDTKRRGRELKQIKKILILFIAANGLYAVWQSILAVLSGRGLYAYWSETITLKSTVKFFLLNESPFSGHLWYLGAILYVLVIVYVLEKYAKCRILYFVTPVLLMSDLLFGKYSVLIMGREFPYIVVRNFLCVGIPYFTFGMWMRCLVKRREFNIGVLSVLVAVFSITTLLERFCLVSLGVNAARDHYLSTTFLAAAVFLLFWTVYQKKTVSRTESFMAMIGRKYSTSVYIVHPILISVFGAVTRRIDMYEVYSIAAPLIVYGASIISMVVFYKLVKKMKGIMRI